MARPREPLDLSTYRNRFADRLVKLRAKNKMLAEDVVAELHARGVPFSKAALFRLEAGKSSPDLDIIPELAAVYGVTPRLLFPEK
ncbi:helix-turn-helix domain-containing protein [Pirellulaceae bacterium SH467]